MLDPTLLEIPVQENVDCSIGLALVTVEDITVSREEFYTLCSQLNEGQQHLFNFIMKHPQQLMVNERNNLSNPEPFCIFLTGGAGVLSLLVKCLTACMKKNLKFHKQNFSEESSLAVTAFTGKAATNVNGATLYSAFRLPVMQPGTCVREKPRNEHLQVLQIRYEFLKIVLIDKISMTHNCTFDGLSGWLRAIKRRNDI